MKAPIQKFIIATIVVTAALSSCSGPRGASTESDSITTDSLSIETEEVIERLPDTVYESVKAMKFEVFTVDTTIDGRLESLRDLYADSKSAMLFRKGIRRDAKFDGLFDSIPRQIEVAWRQTTSENPSHKIYGRWGGGTGWNGQPLYIEWPDSLAERLIKSGMVTADFRGKEVIFGSLIGKVYFFDPETGKPTREEINVTNPIKGTTSFDPTFNGNLYVGQGIPVERPFGALVIDLFANKVTDTFGEDPKAWRQWGAYDSSPVRVGQFLFRPAENGSLYKFTIEPGRQKLHSVLRYRAAGHALGIEASMSVYANYGFIADNHGNIVAVNLDTMQPVWHYTLGDDTDATPLVAVEDGIPYLYVGSEEDLSNRGYAKFAKLDARNGQEIWAIEEKAQRREVEGKHFDGGYYASPLLGIGNCEGMIFTNVVKNTQGSNGSLVAYDRASGKKIYDLQLKQYSWSSPVGALTKNGDMVIINCDGGGNVYVIDAKKGEIVASKTIGYNFESSPVLVDNSIFIGSRSNGLYKITLK